MKVALNELAEKTSENERGVIGLFMAKMKNKLYQNHL
jgi:hypothetical protein